MHNFIEMNLNFENLTAVYEFKLQKYHLYLKFSVCLHILINAVLLEFATCSECVYILSISRQARNL